MLSREGSCHPPQGGRASECGNIISGANFLIVFHSTYGSILLSFRDMTTKRTIDERRTTDLALSVTVAYLAPEADHQSLVDFKNTKFSQRLLDALTVDKRDSS